MTLLKGRLLVGFDICLNYNETITNLLLINLNMLWYGLKARVLMIMGVVDLIDFWEAQMKIEKCELLLIIKGINKMIELIDVWI